ncbi:hypothetical protein [Burkholderia ubonensis]|uniref:hypothetical protein n=1 Tax=Burkholderia ubonensis TaxID=101571 RepID=UPI002AB31A28|nr:hypothetical protein [Burkholderia ubonensis]
MDSAEMMMREASLMERAFRMPSLNLDHPIVDRCIFLFYFLAHSAKMATPIISAAFELAATETFAKQSNFTQEITHESSFDDHQFKIHDPCNEAT